MPSDGPDDMDSGVGSSEPTMATIVPGPDLPPRRVTSRGAEERARSRRLALLGVLVLLLAVLSYVAYFYYINHRLPAPRFVTEKQLQAPEFLYAFSGAGQQVMTRPTGIAIIGDRVYISDQGRRSIRVYTRRGVYISEFSKIADGKNTRLNAPVHIAVGPGNTIWVTDRFLQKLYVFDEQGTFLRTVYPNGDAKFKWAPLALTLDPDGTLYVTDVSDSADHRVLVLAPDGKVRASWGGTVQITRANEAPGKFYFPNGIALRGTGKTAEVFVADGDNRRVQVFTAAGTFVRLINTSGTPRGLWIDRQNRLYVTDALAHRVDLYSDKGVVLIGFGENGIGPGQFSFPNDIVVDSSNGRIFVADRENNQVQVWGFAAAEIPGVTQITPNNWWLCLLPWPFLLIPLLFRRRRFVATADFIEGMITADLVGVMQSSRSRWIVTEADYPQFEGRTVDGIALADLLHPEPYSASDAGSLAQRLSVGVELAGLLAMARRYRILCTEDLDTARFAVALKVDVYDREAWIARFVRKPAVTGGE